MTEPEKIPKGIIGLIETERLRKKLKMLLNEKDGFALEIHRRAAERLFECERRYSIGEKNSIEDWLSDYLAWKKKKEAKLASTR